MSELAPGNRVGVFEVIGLLGQGGMGKVYRARDTRLNRDVALKILPDAFAADPDRLARFTREAQTLAALNHPHIAHIHGLEESGDVRALVMELVEGEDLSQRITRGRMPLDEALPIARQIAEALEAAHEQGIIHRDLKPANIKVTSDGTVKVLDFGLAKALDTGSGLGAPGSVNATNSPTLSIHATQAGIILGTAAYMSPEQARGRPTDKRSDVWSFGCVLFEMLSGKRAFDGEDATEIIAAVVKMPPDWTALPADVPTHIATLIRRCLEKDRKLRIGDIAVARFLLSDGAMLAASPTAGAPARSRAGFLAAGVAAVLAVALAALANIHFREQPPVVKPVRFQVLPPAESGFSSAAALLSPDGTMLAFSARGASGILQLWVQPLDSLTARPLPGTETGIDPFWSPDSRYLGFAVQNRLKKVAIAGGVPQTICELSRAWRSGAWGAGEIIFGMQGSGLLRVSEAGGAPLPLTSLDRSRGESFHGAPWLLPDRRHFLYFRAAGTDAENTGIYVGSLDAAPEQQSTERLVASGYNPEYAPSAASRPGWLLFVRDGSLLAQPFDAVRRAVAGDALPLADSMPAGPKPYSASLTGALAYRSAATATQRRLTWFDRSGKSLGTAGEPGDYNTVSLSPDGSRAALSRVAELPQSNPTNDLWIVEFARGTSTRLTAGPEHDWLATWSADGEHIIFSSGRSGNNELFRIASNGAGKEEAVFQSPAAEFAQDWSGDGRFLLYSTTNVLEQSAVGNLDLAVLDLNGGAKSQPYLKTEFNESQGRFSPDGRFVAYTSNASGQSQVYVQTFPNPQGGKWMISRDGGVQPRWRRDGRELFFISGDSKMMAVDITTVPVFTPGIPKQLFDAPIWGGAQTNNVTRYDVSADGKRFLINATVSESRSTPITVLLNWEGILKR
jgi:Tol biopolymer transport system component